MFYQTICPARTRAPYIKETSFGLGPGMILNLMPIARVTYSTTYVDLLERAYSPKCRYMRYFVLRKARCNRVRNPAQTNPERSKSTQAHAKTAKKKCSAGNRYMYILGAARASTNPMHSQYMRLYESINSKRNVLYTNKRGKT